jgi:hypothetical protein
MPAPVDRSALQGGGRAALALLAASLLVACGGGDGASDNTREEWVSETSVEGNVTTVHTVSGSVWGAPARLEETLSIGVEAGEEPYMFGQLRGVAALDGRIYVLDGSVPAVRVYDGEGRHLMDIGA